MATVSQIREGLATRLGNISGLRTAATVPDDPNPPQAIVMPQEIQYDTAMARGLDTFTYTILVIVGRVDERSAQNLLDGYCPSTGSTSIKTALEDDKSLGGVAKDLRVTSMRNYSSVTVGPNTYLGAEFTCVVYAN